MPLPNLKQFHQETERILGVIIERRAAEGYANMPPTACFLDREQHAVILPLIVESGRRVDEGWLHECIRTYATEQRAVLVAYMAEAERTSLDGSSAPAAAALLYVESGTGESATFSYDVIEGALIRPGERWSEAVTAWPLLPQNKLREQLDFSPN